jgi:hypothetical protein
MCLIQDLYHCLITLARFLILVQERDIVLYTQRKGNCGQQEISRKRKIAVFFRLKKILEQGMMRKI